MRGDAVVMAHAGRSFARLNDDEYRIRCDVPEDYARLIASLATDGKLPDLIYHLWSVTGAQAERDPMKSVDTTLALGFYSLLYLAQAIGADDASHAIDLVVVSDGMQRVCDEQAPSPTKATLLGPCRVIPRELPNIRARSVDVCLPSSGSASEAWLIDALLAEPYAEDHAETVALRHRERWVQQFAPARPSRRDKAPPRIRPGGTYVITGGLGEIGLALGQHLAATAKTQIGLVARKSLPPRELWPAMLTDRTRDARDVRCVRQILAMEQSGSRVLLVTADVADRRAMQKAIRDVRAAFGPIHGVFHAAGILDDGLIQLKDATGAARVLAPKVHGTLSLHAALAKETPDFVMLFSSVSASLGAAGQVDYAGATAFLDAFAQSEALKDSGTVVAVDWSQWQDIGMAAALARGGLSIDVIGDDAGTASDYPLLDTRLSSPREYRFATRFNARRHWLLDEHRVLGDGKALIPGTGFIEIIRAAADTIPRTNSGAPGIAGRPLPGTVFRRGRRRPRPPPSFQSWRRRYVAVRADQPVIGWRHGRACSRASEPRGFCRSRPAADRRDPRAVSRAGGDRAVRAHEVRSALGKRGRDRCRPERSPADARPAPAFAADLDTPGIHPALLDLATAGAQMICLGLDPARDFFVPASYAQIRLYSPMTATMVSHVRLLPEASGADVACYDVTISDVHGLVIADIREFTMVRVQGRTMAAPEPAVPLARAPTCRGNSPTRASTHSTGIRTDEGMAVIDCLLAQSLGPQIVVAPQDFVASLAAARTPSAASRGAARDGGGAGDDDPGRTAMTKTEGLIADMWRDMLGVDRLSPADNFFDLGGHSLLAVQFINKLRKRLGVPVPVTALIETPTLGALAARFEPAASPGLTDDEGSAARPAGLGRDAVMIAGGGRATPLFLVHDGLGEILLYRTLATRIGDERPIYGLQPEVRADGSFIHTAIATMAAAHIVKIRQVQPKGPYLLAGLCAGGVIAFEMARQPRGSRRSGLVCRDHRCRRCRGARAALLRGAVALEAVRRAVDRVPSFRFGNGQP
ncbi:SDR family oxidoreductase [Sphingomonas aurantiaca]|uniref:SDR family oxidoreductase n=1 Tax=Sphingomonas aurantiaca TaxID=185949 RepID=UPI002FDF9A7A